MKRSNYEIANEDITIHDVVRKLGVENVPDWDAMTSPKLQCPLNCSLEYELSFRLYGDSNTGHCFACGKTWGPVALWAEAKDMDWRQASDALLEIFGISGESIEERWAELIKPPRVLVDMSSLAEALKLYCARIEPRWEERQFEPHVADVLSRCLGMLLAIQSEDEVDIWREKTKLIMKSVLKATNGE